MKLVVQRGKRVSYPLLSQMCREEGAHTSVGHRHAMIWFCILATTKPLSGVRLAYGQSKMESAVRRVVKDVAAEHMLASATQLVCT